MGKMPNKPLVSCCLMKHGLNSRWRISLAGIFSLALATATDAASPSGFRAGAVATDISPTTFPRIIAGGFLEGRGDKLTSALHSRAIVLDDGKMQIAFAIVDTCMMEQKLIDEAKALASKQCGIPVDRMMVSATHTHSAPAAMGCLGTRQDPEYAKFLIPKIAESIVEAHKRLQPAHIGWGSIDDWEHTHNRRWIRLAGKEVVDPFGNATGRANMHPGYLSKDVVGPSGPVDPQLSVISIQTKDGKPLAVLANYSQHYFGQSPVSADYFGLFCDIIAKRIGGDDKFVCAMSQGTSGDQMWMDYGAEKKNITIQEYSEAVADYAMKALKSIKHQDEAPLGMIEKHLTLKYRTPDKERLTWAQRIAAQIKNDVPKNKEEVYAREAVILDQRKETTLKVQAIRIGDLSIATLPNEVYAITGLKLKELPLLQGRQHFNIELANGAEGYIPPRDQHDFGGYTTWPARTAGLEIFAETQILESLIEATYEVSGRAALPSSFVPGDYLAALKGTNPCAHWQLESHDQYYGNPILFRKPKNENTQRHEEGTPEYVKSGLGPSLRYKGRIAFGLPGVGSGRGYGDESVLRASAFGLSGEINRGVHLSDGHLEVSPHRSDAIASIALWFWLGHESGASDRSGHLMDALGTRVVAHQFPDHTVRLELGDAHSEGKVYADDWHFAVLIRDGDQVRVHLDGNEKPILTGKAGENTKDLIFGKGLQGKLDEITVWDRAIEPKLIAQLWKTSKVEADNARHAIERAERAKRASVQTTGLLKQHENWSVSMRFRNTKKNNVSPVTAYLVSRGPKGDHQAPGDHLGIGGNYKDSEPGKLFVFNGNAADQIVRGKTLIEPGTWNDVKLERTGAHVKVTLNGKVEIDAELPVTAAGAKDLLFGRRCDDLAPLEGEYQNVVVTGLETPKAEPPPKLELASQPLSPQESLKKLHVRDGYDAQLVAHEPQVLDPVAFDWDSKGRLWVVEMADYPLGMDGNGKAGGRVRVLSEPDKNGRFTKSTLFADGLNFPNGILVWRDGVIVTAAPDIWFLKDSDGDGKADQREVLYTGFSEGNQQLRVNGLRWGMDGWVYCAAGGHHANYNKGTLIQCKRSGQKVDLGARDFRFRPDTGEFDPQTGPSQFGRCRDDWDHWFGVQNSKPLWHFVLQDNYLRRNPHVIPPDPVNLLYPLNPPVYPASAPEKRFHSFNQAGRYTSACGIDFYRDSLLFGDKKMHAFTCEPFHNLAQHHVLADDGVTFKAARDETETGTDFFASEDRWCRPVMVRTGPDGAMWVADMYRYMIEHPQWLPENGKSELLPFYREGDNAGRLYRVFPKGKAPTTMKPLDGQTNAQLVALLASSNGWLRDHAQMELVWRKAGDVDGALIAMASDGATPQSRAQSAWTLELLGKMTPAICQRLLGDASARVREQGLLIAEKHPSDALIDVAAKLVNDDAKVRLQLACSLGEWKSPKAGAALAALLKKDAANATIVGAVMSSAVPHLVTLAKGARGLAFDTLLSTALAAKDDAALEQMLGSLANDEGDALVRLQSFHGLLTSLQRRETSLVKFAATMNGEKLKQQVAGLDALFAKAEQLALKHEGGAADRAMLMEIALLDGAHRQAGMKRLDDWLDSADATEQEAAITLLSRHAPKQSEAKLLAKWTSVTPALRNVLLDALMNSSSERLLASVKQGDVPAAAFDAQRQARLLNHPNKKVKDLAAGVFNQTATSKRADVIAKFQPALKLKGDAARGKAAFATICIACHQLEGAGIPLGPDLRSVVQHTPEKLLQSILDPTAIIEPSFMAYFCTLKSGEQLYGIVASETSNSITLKLPGNLVRPILRSEITSLKSTQQSLMPDGLEATLTPQSLADLISYLQTPKQ